MSELIYRPWTVGEDGVKFASEEERESFAKAEYVARTTATLGHDLRLTPVYVPTDVFDWLVGTSTDGWSWSRFNQCGDAALQLFRDIERYQHIRWTLRCELANLDRVMEVVPMGWVDPTCPACGGTGGGDEPHLACPTCHGEAETDPEGFPPNLTISVPITTQAEHDEAWKKLAQAPYRREFDYREVVEAINSDDPFGYTDGVPGGPIERVRVPSRPKIRKVLKGERTGIAVGSQDDWLVAIINAANEAGIPITEGESE